MGMEVSDNAVFGTGGCCLSVITVILSLFVWRRFASVREERGRAAAAAAAASENCTNHDCVRCNGLALDKEMTQWCVRKLRCVNYPEAILKLIPCSGVPLTKLELEHLPPLSTLASPFDYEVSILESACADITGELQHLYKNRRQFWVRNETQTGGGGGWDLAFLINQGQVNEAVAEVCPKTVLVMNLLRHSLVSPCIFGNVVFSVLHPGTVIRPHQGPTNARIRCHLALVCPPEGCSMTVDGRQYSWVEGKCLIFDDYLTHSVTHYGHSHRTVLMLDFWHPHISQADRSVLGTLCAARGQFSSP